MLEAGLLWLPAVLDKQCSEVYFFLGTRALKVAVLRLAAGFGLLLALGVLLLLQLLPPLSLWLPPPLASNDLPDLSSTEDINSFSESATAAAAAAASDSPSPDDSTSPEESRPLIGSAADDSECELEENEDEDEEEEEVWFCGDLLLSLFSSESLFSPPASAASPAPRRFPPLARVEGGERRPCFFIGFIFSSSSPFFLFFPSPNKSFPSFLF